MSRIEEIMVVERCRRDAHYFIFESGLLKSKDEQDIEQQVKAVPDLPYLRVLLDLYLVGSIIIPPSKATYAREVGISNEFLDFLAQTHILCVEKSRDLFVNNMTCCFIHWRAKFLNYQKIIVQSKNEDDAANLVYNKDEDVARISFQEYYLPAYLKTANLKKWSYCNAIWESGPAHLENIDLGMTSLRNHLRRDLRSGNQRRADLHGLAFADHEHLVESDFNAHFCRYLFYLDFLASDDAVLLAAGYYDRIHDGLQTALRKGEDYTREARRVKALISNWFARAG